MVRFLWTDDLKEIKIEKSYLLGNFCSKTFSKWEKFKTKLERSKLFVQEQCQSELLGTRYSSGFCWMELPWLGSFCPRLALYSVRAVRRNKQLMKDLKTPVPQTHLCIARASLQRVRL